MAGSFFPIQVSVPYRYRYNFMHCINI